MDAKSLKPAATYINNLLLARGLLRNGEPIPFDRSKQQEGGTDAVMARVMNLVHDMILRRDRETDHLSNLSTHLRTVESDNERLKNLLKRAENDIDSLKRKHGLSQSAERNAQQFASSAEGQVKTMQNEIAKLKQTVKHVRTECKNDVRKRDVMIERLKSHLNARQRGNKVGVIGGSITITPGGSTGNNLRTAGGRPATGGPDVEDPAYSLKQESTEFLTQLSQSLSDENDGLIALVRTATNDVKSLLGLEDAAKDGSTATNGHESQSITALPTSYEVLSTDLNGVLDDLRQVLTSPNFVALEEVLVRDDEIGRLREGWEKMEIKWREAVGMMEGWRKRMEEKGDMVNLDEVKRGLGLGIGFEDLCASIKRSTCKRRSSVASHQLHADEQLSDPSDDIESSGDMFNIGPISAKPALQEITGNAKSNAPPATLLVREEPSDTEATARPSKLDIVATAPMLSPTRRKAKSRRENPPVATAQEAARHRAAQKSAKGSTTSTKRSSSPHPLEPEPKLRCSLPDMDSEDDEIEEPKLTVQERLNLAQAEAEAAARQADEMAETAKDTNKPSRLPKPRAISNSDTAKLQQESDDKVLSLGPGGQGSPSKPMKRTKVYGRPRRRKSTLSPEELAALIGL